MPVGNMFQRKIDELFQGLFNAFAIAGNILIAGYDEVSREHDAKLDEVLRICRQASLKLNKDKCLFGYTSIPFLEEIILWYSVIPDPRRVQALMIMPPPK